MDYELIAAGRENVSPWSQAVNKTLNGTLTTVVILAPNPPVQIVVKRLHIAVICHNTPQPLATGLQVRVDNSDGQSFYQEDGWVGNTLAEGGVQQIYTSERDFTPGLRLVQGKGLSIRLAGGSASTGIQYNVALDGYLIINAQLPASPAIIF